LAPEKKARPNRLYHQSFHGIGGHTPKNPRYWMNFRLTYHILCENDSNTQQKYQLSAVYLFEHLANSPDGVGWYAVATWRLIHSTWAI